MKSFAETSLGKESAKKIEKQVKGHHRDPVKPVSDKDEIAEQKAGEKLEQ